jgi:hypothetical protein
MRIGKIAIVFVVLVGMLGVGTSSDAAHTRSKHDAVQRCKKSHKRHRRHEKCPRRAMNKNRRSSLSKPQVQAVGTPSAGSPATLPPATPSTTTSSPTVPSAASSSGSQPSNCPAWHYSPEETPGPEELSGGIYDVGGPATSDEVCGQNPPSSLAGTITVRKDGTAVSTQTVSQGQTYAIPLTPGLYEAESTMCQIGEPVQFTIEQGQTTEYDFICPIS